MKPSETRQTNILLGFVIVALAAVLLSLVFILFFKPKVWDRPEISISSSEVERGERLDFVIKSLFVKDGARVIRSYFCEGVIYPIDIVEPNKMNAPMVVPPRVPSGSVCSLEIEVSASGVLRELTDTVISEAKFTAL